MTAVFKDAGTTLIPGDVLVKVAALPYKLFSTVIESHFSVLLLGVVDLEIETVL